MTTRRRPLALALAALLVAIALGIAAVPPDESGTPGVGDPRSPAPLPAGGQRTVDVAPLPAGDQREAPRPPAIRARVGETLTLRISARAPDTVAVDDYSGASPVSPDAPTELELLLDRPGEFAVRSIESGTVRARLLVSPAR